MGGMQVDDGVMGVQIPVQPFLENITRRSRNDASLFHYFTTHFGSVGPGANSALMDQNQRKKLWPKLATRTLID